jgi:hypothetical protein
MCKTSWYENHADMGRINALKSWYARLRTLFAISITVRRGLRIEAFWRSFW